MPKTGHSGTLLLTLAQAWHAATGYFIFVAVAQSLGQESFGDFGLVLWTMTTLEVFVVDGFPRAVAWAVAKHPGASFALLRRGLRLTTVTAVVFAAGLLLAAPALSAHWDRPGLAPALRLAALDFVAFVAFAVYVQAANGLHRFGLQAGTWFHYSTWKTVLVAGAVRLDFGLEGAVWGYVLASFLGSAGAFVFGRRAVKKGGDPPAEKFRTLAGFGLPLATQSFGLLLIINADLSAAGSCGASRLLHGAYTGASTLARALFFIFRAFGEALFPQVARHLAEGRPEEACRSVRKGLALLSVLLLPATGLATGTAGPVLVILFDDPGYAEGVPFLRLLAPAAAAFALTAVLAALVSATARPWRIAAFVLGLFAFDAALVYPMAGALGPVGAAWGALTASLAGLAAGSVLLTRALPSVLPGRAFLASLAAAAGLHYLLDSFAFDSWIVFPAGALAWAATAATLVSLRCVPGLTIGRPSRR